MEPSSLYFTTVSGLQRGTAVVGGHLVGEELDPSITRFMFMQNGTWGHWFDLEDIVYSTVSFPRSETGGKANVTALTRGGRLWSVVSGGEPYDVQLDVSGGYYMLNACRVKGTLFCCGVQNMVFRIQDGVVDRIDEGLFKPIEDRVDRVLESISGFGVTDVFAAGHAGKILHWNGYVWTEEPTITNLDLFSIHCSSDGSVVATGGACTVLKRSQSGIWSDLSSDNFPNSSIRGIAEYGGQIYMAASEKLLTIRDSVVEEVEVDALSHVKCRFYSISSDGERLWAAGDNALVSFDGTSWVGFEGS